MRISHLLFTIIVFSLSSFAQPVSQYQEIIYGHKDGMALTMVHLPPSGQPKGKAIMVVVSGNWVSTYRRIPKPIQDASIYVRNGFSVFLVMHGSQPRYAVTDMVSDLQRAVRFIRFHAKTYSIDPDKIGITGNSSGGNLSLLVATASEKVETAVTDSIDMVSSRVQAAAVFYPPTNFLDWAGKDFSDKLNEPGILRARVKGAFDFRQWNDTTNLYELISDSVERIKRFRTSSPFFAVTKDDPPVLIVHGDNDRVVPLQQSEIFIERMKAAGVANRLIIHKGGDHGWDHMDADRQHMVEWFAKYLE